MIFHVYDGDNYNVKLVFDGAIGHPYLNVQTLNQLSMWGDCLVQLMYIGDNALSVQGFCWFTMSYDGVIYSIQPGIIAPEGFLEVSFQFFL